MPGIAVERERALEMRASSPRVAPASFHGAEPLQRAREQHRVLASATQIERFFQECPCPVEIPGTERQFGGAHPGENRKVASRFRYPVDCPRKEIASDGEMPADPPE